MFRGFVGEDNGPVRAASVARTRCRALGADEIFDRATETAKLMDFCTVQSEAEARSATANSRFPPVSGAGVHTGTRAADALHRSHENRHL